MSEMRFWVRNRLRHVAAHVVARWDQRQAALMCGEEPSPGGEVITFDEARQLQAHVCIGCARRVNGTSR